MSDFLRNLVSRNLGTLEVVQPRVPSIFEPYRRGTGLGERPNVAAQQTESEVSGEGSVQAPSTVSPDTMSSSTPPTARENPFRRVAKPEFKPPAPAMGSSPLGALQPQLQDRLSDRKTRSEAQSSQNVPEQARELSSNVMDNRPISRISAIKSTEQQSVPQSLAHPDVAAIPATGGDEAQGSSAQISAPIAPTPFAALKTSPPARASVSPVRPPLPTRSAAAQQLGSTPATSPAVQISIGRVEVRAVFPAPTVRRPAPSRSRPTVSLDDYLNRRQGGKR